MSPKKKAAAAGVSEATNARLATAIADCNSAWRERWKRKPTLKELVHPFDICLGAHADDFVSDPEVVLDEPHATGPRPDTVEPSRFSLSEVDGPTPNVTTYRATSVNLAVTIELELDGRTVIVDASRDYFTTLNMHPHDVRRLVLFKVVPRFLMREKAEADRVILRSGDSLADPENHSLD